MNNEEIIIPFCWYCPVCGFEEYNHVQRHECCPNDHSKMLQQTFKYRVERHEELNLLKNDIKQIQLDVYKAGMTEAAEIVEQQGQTCVIFADPKTSLRLAANSVISARDRKVSL